jgi:hypothetical protein
VNINTCTPMPPNDWNCSSNLTGGKVQVYWENAPAATHITMTLSPQTATGNCPKPGNDVLKYYHTPSTTPNGGPWEKTGISRGYWSLKLEISGPLGYRSRNNMPIKMDCDFLASSVEDPLVTPIPGAEPQVLPPTEIPPPVDAMKPIATPHP